MRLAVYSGYGHPRVMIEKLGLTAADLRDIRLYAAIEPVGEGMSDYRAGDSDEAPAADDPDRVARLKKLAVRQQRELARDRK